MDYIKQLTGHYMLEDNSNYHVQYDTGVNIDLNQPVFDAPKIQLLHDFIV